jgi:uncharacterized membrane protein YbaN (DUF454 family)
MRRWILVSCGLVSVTLATIGIVVPLLPTTPLLLLAAACFVRSSDRLYGWLTHHRLFGPYIRNYREHRAVTRVTKVFTLVLLWAAIGYSAVVVVRSLAVRIVLLVIAVGVTVHVLTLRTLTKEMVSADRASKPDDRPSH